MDIFNEDFLNAYGNHPDLIQARTDIIRTTKQIQELETVKNNAYETLHRLCKEYRTQLLRDKYKNETSN